jgi:hypothetical protein
VSKEINDTLQLSDHSEDRTIRIGRLAHEIAGGFDAADDDDVHPEDLDVHYITCFSCVQSKNVRQDSAGRALRPGTRRGANG